MEGAGLMIHSLKKRIMKSRKKFTRIKSINGGFKIKETNKGSQINKQGSQIKEINNKGSQIKQINNEGSRIKEIKRRDHKLIRRLHKLKVVYQMKICAYTMNQSKVKPFLYW